MTFGGIFLAWEIVSFRPRRLTFIGSEKVAIGEPRVGYYPFYGIMKVRKRPLKAQERVPRGKNDRVYRHNSAHNILPK